MTIVAIIPARYGSVRLPGKPLAMIGDKPMIRHVYESASKARGLSQVLVATDDTRIMRVVKEFGGDVVLTSKKHNSGTDRLAEAAKRIKAQWIINIQGDLPFVRPETITRAVRPLLRDDRIAMGTVRTPIRREEEWLNPNVVKVVTDNRGFALYFSRAAIPYARNRPVDGDEKETVWGYRHIGIYAYRRDFLLRFARLRPVPLERTEGLEQLRALAHGYRIRVADAEEPSVEVDTPEDLKQAEVFLKRSA
jgi:3-deoxy-manno-octulosonate cytidylyltransferase (CMP-KDO synthetase)